ncbi:MAG: dTDP-glucose 4,6-dehydratase [Chlamydiae bacterium]|nr:dTDP-glucose 4,6-dehydratase [Chlamydiota bacterium]
MIRTPKNILVTGGAGFIGSAFIRYSLSKDSCCEKIVNLDLLTYAADLKNLSSIESDPRYHLAIADICDEEVVESLCKEHGVDTIVHFAAESHVDRSIEGPAAFCRTNIEGTLHLLEVVRRNPSIHFHHVSTDEVYGSLGKEGAFNESSPICPNSPYAASKAASDHLVRAFANTYGISTTISHCSNNYGPCQNGEKLIPLMLSCLIEKRPLPIYGKGENIRDWLYVDDHVEALWTILQKAPKGSVFDIGGGYEASNIEIVHRLIEEYCSLTSQNTEEFTQLIHYVTDRPGHDFRYSIDPAKIQRELGWSPKYDFAKGLKETVQWYLENRRLQGCGV